MRERPKRWRMGCDRDLSWGPQMWVLGLYWNPYPDPQFAPVGSRIYRRYVEFRMDTSNPFSLRHNLK